MSKPINVKMAQVTDDPYGVTNESWEPGKEDPAHEQVPSPELSKEDIGEELAKEWQADYARLGPEFYVELRTLETIRGLQALGLSATTKEQLLELAGLFVDDVGLMDDLVGLNDSEWNLLLQHTNKAPSAPPPTVASVRLSMTRVAGRVSMKHVMAQTQESITLLRAMEDLGLEVSADDAKTTKALQMISASPTSSFAQLATQILKMDPGTRRSLFMGFDRTKQKEEQADDLQLEQGKLLLQPSQMQFTDDAGRPVVEDMLTVQPTYTTKIPSSEKDPFIEQTKKRLWPKEFGGKPQPGVPAATEAPAAPAEQGVAGPSLPVDVRKAPKSTQLKYFVNNYDQYVADLPPEATPVPYGETIPVPVFPQQRRKGDMPNNTTRAGKFVRSYTNKDDAMVVGFTNDKKLVVRVFPSGALAIWDVKEMDVADSTLPSKRD